MKRSFFSSPDPFSSSPVLSILPVKGKVGELAKLTSSLFARHEKVQNQLLELDKGSEPQLAKSLSAEEAMLKHVLDWLALKPGRGEE